MRTAHGVTEIGGVKWLVQNQQLTNAIGLPGQPTFQRAQYKYDCPHHFDLSVTSTAQLEEDLAKIQADPVARFLLPSIIDPLSEERLIKYAPQPDPRLIERLTYLWGAGSWSRIQSFRSPHKATINRLIADTNLLPLIMFDANFLYQPQMDAIASMQLNNRVLMFGDNTPVIPSWSMERIEPMKLKLIDTAKMDLPTIGSLYLRNQMRRS